jgi:hypothetical protein
MIVFKFPQIRLVVLIILVVIMVWSVSMLNMVPKVLGKMDIEIIEPARPYWATITGRETDHYEISLNVTVTNVGNRDLSTFIIVPHIREISSKVKEYSNLTYEFPHSVKGNSSTLVTVKYLFSYKDITPEEAVSTFSKAKISIISSYWIPVMPTSFIEAHPGVSKVPKTLFALIGVGRTDITCLE